MEISNVKEVLKKFENKKIAVIGDLMLDHYLWGNVERISPEAPVPIIDVKKEEFRLGGAANVVNNLISLKAKPYVFGICGEDHYRKIMIKLLEDLNVTTSFIITDPNRSTTVKSRIVAGQQQIARLDFEKREDISKEITDKFLMNFKTVITDLDAIIIEDYNKGFLTAEVIESVIDLANEYHKPITVDPKFKNFFSYKKTTVFKPNFIELQKNMGIEITSEEELKSVAQELFNRIDPKYLLITRGERGMVIYDREGNEYKIPTFAREVFDVSGAGDTVISVLTLCMSVGCDIQTSAIIANHAAGAVCGKMGIAPATQKDIILSIEYFDPSKEN